MRFDRQLFAFLLLLSLVGCSGKKAENTSGRAAGDGSGDAKLNQSTREQVFSNIAAPGGNSGDGQSAAESADVIKGWGKKEDPAGGTTIELQGTTLVMTTPDIYVDNYPPGKVNAPRVLQEVSGDFTVEVKVTHLDPSKTDSVLKSLGSFPTAYHAGTLLVRTNEKNFIRFEKGSKNTRGMHATTCELQVWENGKRMYYVPEDIEDTVVSLRMERRGDLLLSSFSKDDGKTWKELPQYKLGTLKGAVGVGVSLTNNTAPGCTVKFQDFKLGKGEGR
jgi:regulation of enolase protein 1 (concanavalin A-like superfamily)